MSPRLALKMLVIPFLLFTFSATYAETTIGIGSSSLLSGERKTTGNTTDKNSARTLILPQIAYSTFPLPTLLFPPATTQRVCLSWGVGIPLERDLENVYVGYALKAFYYIPRNVAQLKPSKLPGLLDRRRRRKREKSDDRGFSRWNFYSILEMYAEGYGFGGKECVLRAVCEAAEAAFSHHSGLVGEMLHILMTPSASSDSPSKDSDYEYFYAEKVGSDGESCERVFKECSVSLLKLFSGILEPHVKNSL